MPDRQHLGPAAVDVDGSVDGRHITRGVLKPGGCEAREEMAEVWATYFRWVIGSLRCSVQAITDALLLRLAYNSA